MVYDLMIMSAYTSLSVFSLCMYIASVLVFSLGIYNTNVGVCEHVFISDYLRCNGLLVGASFVFRALILDNTY